MDSMFTILDHFLNAVLKVLPTSPFVKFMDKFSALSQYMGYLNWFIPVSWILDLLVAWCAAIAVFYAYSIVLRWVRAID